MDQLYKKIEIKGESDLPKKSGRYETCCKGELMFRYFEFIDDNIPTEDKDFWMDYVEYYFQPFTPDSKAVIMPTEEDVEKWITEQNYASNNPIIVSYVEGLRDSIKWFRSQVREVELKEELVKAFNAGKESEKALWQYQSGVIDGFTYKERNISVDDYLSARKEGK